MRRCVANGPGNVLYSAFHGHHAVFADNVQSYSTVEPDRPDRADPLEFTWQYSAAAGRSRPRP